MSASNPNVLRQAMKASRSRLYMVAFFSLFINLLMLAGPLYMLQVYDRVLPSSSLETLAALSVLLLGLFVASGCLEFARTRILSRVGTRLEALIAPHTFDAAVRRRLAQSSEDGDESLVDTATIRDFMSGNGPPAFFDLPWAPIYLVVLAMLHPALGLLGLGGTVFVVILAWCNNYSTRTPWGRYAESAATARAIASASQKNAEVIKAMGMAHALRHVWLRHHLRSDVDKGTATDWSGIFSVFSKTSRLLLQSAALGLGAALVIAGEMTAGAMIAGTILLGRALAPIDQSINHWRSYLGARAAYAQDRQSPHVVSRRRAPTFAIAGSGSGSTSNACLPARLVHARPLCQTSISHSRPAKLPPSSVRAPPASRHWRAYCPGSGSRRPVT